jgi:hypothetical protein
MSWLRKKDRQREEVKDPAEEAVCEHITLIPRWDSVEDMGNEELATHYICESCGVTLSASEAAEVRMTQRERIQSKVG